MPRWTLLGRHATGYLADAPSLSAVYKLVELSHDGHIHYTAKFSDDKNTLPGANRSIDIADHDVVALQSECNSDYKGEPLLTAHHDSWRTCRGASVFAKPRERAVKL